MSDKIKPEYITVNFTMHKDGERKNSEQKLPLCQEQLAALKSGNPANADVMKAIDSIIRNIAYLRGYPEYTINHYLTPQEVTHFE